ncbi:MAG: hypothetical protein V4686_02355 [Patescibacteria group bacterium]
MTVTTTPGQETPVVEMRPLRPGELQDLDTQHKKASQGAIEKLVAQQVKKCWDNLEACNEPLTIFARDYIQRQPVPVVTFNSVFNDMWARYFFDSVMCNFPLQMKQIGAWALISVATKGKFFPLGFLADKSLEKVLTRLGITFDLATDILHPECMSPTISPRILQRLATMFELPTDFNENIRSWRIHGYDELATMLVSKTGLIIPPMEEYVHDCERKLKPPGLGHPDSYDRNF